MGLLLNTCIDCIVENKTFLKLSPFGYLCVIKLDEIPESVIGINQICDEWEC